MKKNDREVILFTSPTCGPCKQLKPAILKLHGEHQFRLRLYELSAENRSVFMEHGVRQVPFVLCLEKTDAGREPVGDFYGSRTPQALEAQFREWGLIP